MIMRFTWVTSRSARRCRSSMCAEDLCGGGRHIADAIGGLLDRLRTPGVRRTISPTS